MGDIENDSNSFDKLYPRVIDRYYTRYYDLGKMVEKKEFGVLLQHSNNLFVVFASKDHAAFEGYQKSEEVSVKFAEKAAALKLSGKRKHGAINFKVGETILTMTRGGREYFFRSPIDAQLLEVNTNLNAEHLFSAPEGDDQYVALFMSKHVPRALSCVVKEDSYNKYMTALKAGENVEPPISESAKLEAQRLREKEAKQAAWHAQQALLKEQDSFQAAASSEDTVASAAAAAEDVLQTPRE